MGVCASQLILLLENKKVKTSESNIVLKFCRMCANFLVIIHINNTNSNSQVIMSRLSKLSKVKYSRSEVSKKVGKKGRYEISL